MKKFLAVYTGSPAAMARWQTLSEAERTTRQAAGFKGWVDWVSKNHDSIVDVGAPLGSTKRISSSGVADSRNEMAAFTVVHAHSHEEAAALFLDHPHFTLFPGDAVELMECLPIPGA